MNKQTIKNQLIALLFFMFMCNYSQSEIIKDVVIEGNTRVNSETIKIFGGFSIGDDLNKEDLNKILKDLYETNFFENVSLKLDNSILKISIVENPIIQNLLINGVENDSLKEKLFENISLKEKNPYVENDVRNNLSNIKNILQEVGFYFSSVEILKKENANNTIDLLFEIDLGKKAFIKQIVFLGDKKFKKRKLLNVITSEEDKYWKFLSSKRLLNKQRINLDKR